MPREALVAHPSQHLQGSQPRLILMLKEPPSFRQRSGARVQWPPASASMPGQRTKVPIFGATSQAKWPAHTRILINGYLRLSHDMSHPEQHMRTELRQHKVSYCYQAAARSFQRSQSRRAARLPRRKPQPRDCGDPTLYNNCVNRDTLIHQLL